MSSQAGSKNLAPGVYRHYKGGEYQVYDVATHSETEELVVVYRPLYGEAALWVRPFEMFVELIEFKGKTLPRFEFVRPANDAGL
ncbi:Uncharacterised protein [Zhongshania aliphaticivorans]|uniref:DUF1653 domain-containing protein n=1 Tax=Zhongshania aliphaticivorans TaxID=1470434 RepID=A0A5S9NDE4_9GAMM|nr:DUF1653 domain-containing protein [Zhongshania aliphaticivorans]CAA0088284.1 Uncharacterised protein [Zhongshania aliphaticivorans]CAA0116282.1 Uncharacterised protein [Zhongshania aliphaticivorans]CAA0120405.1 Uncharacterised protein [Zhongshania aliphaticivorans]